MPPEERLNSLYPHLGVLRHSSPLCSSSHRHEGEGETVAATRRRGIASTKTYMRYSWPHSRHDSIWFYTLGKREPNTGFSNLRAQTHYVHRVWGPDHSPPPSSLPLTALRLLL